MSELAVIVGDAPRYSQVVTTLYENACILRQATALEKFEPKALPLLILGDPVIKVA